MILRAFASIVFLLAATDAFAVAPSQICTGDPCVVSADTVIDSGGAATFGSELRVLR